MNVNRKQTQQQSASTGFPLLSYVELAECLVALGISVSAEDISKPTPVVTQQIFLQLVDILMGAPMESMEGPKATLLGMMEYKVCTMSELSWRGGETDMAKELYGDALSFTMFYRHWSVPWCSRERETWHTVLISEQPKARSRLQRLGLQLV